MLNHKLYCRQISLEFWNRFCHANGVMMELCSFQDMVKMHLIHFRPCEFPLSVNTVASLSMNLKLILCLFLSSSCRRYEMGDAVGHWICPRRAGSSFSSCFSGPFVHLWWNGPNRCTGLNVQVPHRWVQTRMTGKWLDYHEQLAKPCCLLHCLQMTKLLCLWEPAQLW